MNVLVPKSHESLLPFTKRVLFAIAPYANKLEPVSARRLFLELCDPETRLQVEQYPTIMDWWAKRFPNEGPIINLVSNALGYLSTIETKVNDETYFGLGHLLAIGTVGANDPNDAGICWVWNPMLPASEFEEIDVSLTLSRPLLNDINGLHPLPPRKQLDERLHKPLGNA